MNESLVQRALSTQGSTSLVDLILSPAEIQMDTWKPNVQNVIQQFQDFDNEGYAYQKLSLRYCAKFKTALQQLQGSFSVWT